MKRFFLFILVLVCLISCEQNQNIPNNENGEVTYTMNRDSYIRFAVSENSYVAFSKGNLQYQASSNTWRFADKQYDVIGEENANVSENYDGWIDLFGWGTSGYNNRMPYMILDSELSYTETYSIAETNYDWGVYNEIQNDKGDKGIWRTLTADEWKYLILERKNAPKLNAWAKVNGVAGLVILPDDCVLPDDVAFEFTEEYGEDFQVENVYDLTQWQKLETVGALFLPAAGQHINKSVGGVNRTCFYWSSSLGSFNNSASYFSFNTFGPYPFDDAASAPYYNGFAVRLVRDIQ